MNANELAEQLVEYAGNSGYSHNDYADSMSQAATMLRQQQAEIEALKDCKNQYQEVNRNILNDLMIARKRIEQLLETQDYLYKTHDADKAEIEALKLCCPKCGGVIGISEVLNHQVKELKIHEDIVYGLAYKHRIEKGDVQGFAMELLRKESEK